MTPQVASQKSQNSHVDLAVQQRIAAAKRKAEEKRRRRAQLAQRWRLTRAG
ncbi:hypothetical protein [Streptomyces sp. NRRL F-5630]|uniref:hypothetical protein n=1 Tax=Streptomyces sp. NRRL F-5630 TaxID=1463864 RepID=UPI003EC03ADC